MTHWSRTTTQGESGIEFYLTATEGSTKSVTHLPNHRSLFKLMKLHTSGLAIARHSGEFSSSSSFSFPINKFTKILYCPLPALRALYSLIVVVRIRVRFHHLSRNVPTNRLEKSQTHFFSLFRYYSHPLPLLD